MRIYSNIRTMGVHGGVTRRVLIAATAYGSLEKQHLSLEMSTRF